MKPLAFSAATAVSAVGWGLDALTTALRERRGGLRKNDFEHCRLDTYIGRIDGIEAVQLPEHLAAFDCRNNRIAVAALQHDDFGSAVASARARHGAGRIATIIGTSTSGILQTELAYRCRSEDGALPPHYSFHHTHELFSVVACVQDALGLSGPAFAVSTACSSSAKVFADAARLITAGLCDAAVVGGVDSLCLTTLHGFDSLELVSPEPCRPFAADRRGISIGEAAGFVLLERLGDVGDSLGVALLGYGESSDAHHMSTPHPEGKGAAMAMRAALERGGTAAGDVDYMNLHGTGTRSNDRSEDAGVRAIFGDALPASSTKGWTGHTLGAAGVTEAIITALAIRHGMMPGTLNTGERDPDLGLNLLLDNHLAPVRRAMSNSFGFGGNNCSLLLGAI